MSVYDNMAYGLKIRGFGKDHIRQQSGGGAHPELEPLLLKRKPRELSGGQRQRVAMGRAIVREPAVFPCSMSRCPTRTPSCGADAHRAATATSSSETTSLYVTHDQVEAMTLAQRVIVMNKGVAEQVGTRAKCTNGRLRCLSRALSDRRR